MWVSLWPEVALAPCPRAHHRVVCSPKVSKNWSKKKNSHVPIQIGTNVNSYVITHVFVVENSETRSTNSHVFFFGYRQIRMLNSYVQPPSLHRYTMRPSQCLSIQTQVHSIARNKNISVNHSSTLAKATSVISGCFRLSTKTSMRSWSVLKTQEIVSNHERHDIKTV